MSPEHGLTADIRAAKDSVRGDPPDPVPAARPVETEQEPETLQRSEGRHLRKVSTDTRRMLPEDTALLRVVAAAEDRYHLALHFRGDTDVTNSDEEFKRQRPPNLKLADFIEGTEWKRDDTKAVKAILEGLANWSVNVDKLNRWLTELRAELGAGLRLIVWDDTDYEIPWELFWHTVDGDGVWLGTVVPLIRWTTVHAGDLPSWQDSGPTGLDLFGKILAYEDTELVPVTDRLFEKRERPPGYQQMPSMDELVETLENRSGEVDFVYVRCHGTYGKSLTEMCLGGFTLSELVFRTPHMLRRCQPLMFLNACNSARSLVDPDLGSLMSRSFAEFFLRHKARAVIATLAEVDKLQSSILAKEFLRDAMTKPNPLPEQLRRHREDRAKLLPRNTRNLDAEGRDHIKAFLIASMFAYIEAADETVGWDPDGD